MAKTRNVSKRLASMEDLLQGKGVVSQKRGDQDYDVHRVDVPFALDTEAEMQALDVTRYNRARVYSDEHTAVDYVYDPDAVEGITPNDGPGYWVELRTGTALAVTGPSIVANTVADAKLLVTVLGISITTLGYHSVNDGGAAEYVVVAGGTGTDDGGSYHNMANGNQLELIAEDVISINTFGAKEGVDISATLGAVFLYAGQQAKISALPLNYTIDNVVQVVEKGRPDNGVFEIDFSGSVFAGTGGFVFDSCKNLSVIGLQAPTQNITLRGVWYSNFRQCKASQLINADQAGTTFTSCYWNDFHTCVFQTIIRGATEYPVNAYTFYGVSLRGNTGQGFVTTADYNIIMLGTTSAGNAQNWVFYGGDISYAGIATEDLSGSHVDADIEITYNGVYFDSVIPAPVLKGNTRIATRDCHVANFSSLTETRGAIGTAPHELHRSDRSVKLDPVSDTNMVVGGDFTTMAAEVTGTNGVVSSTGGAVVTNSFGGLKGQILNISQGGTGTTFIRALAAKDIGIATCSIALRSSVVGVPQQVKIGFKHGAVSSRFSEITVNDDWTYYALTDTELAAVGVTPSISFSNVDANPYNIDIGFISVSMGAGSVLDGASDTPRSIVVKASVDVGSIPPLDRHVVDIPVVGSVSRDSFVSVSHLWGNMVVSSSLVVAGVVRLIIFNPTGSAYAPGAVTCYVKVTERVNGSM